MRKRGYRFESYWGAKTKCMSAKEIFKMLTSAKRKFYWEKKNGLLKTYTLEELTKNLKTSQGS